MLNCVRSKAFAGQQRDFGSVSDVFLFHNTYITSYLTKINNQTR